MKIVRKLRHAIAGNADALAAAAAAVSGRPVAEKLVSEVLPLAEACRWLERRAAHVLAPRRCGSTARPLWLWGSSFEVQRQPFGTVLVIGPGNYPLFLPGVHTLHALAAGNSVLLKPAPATRDVALAFAELAHGAGLERELLTVLPDSVEAARDAIQRGVDKVVFTGSSVNGRAVLAELALSNTPAVMELSGVDPVLVLEDADLDLAARAVRFGTAINAGETCIAPRRLLVATRIAGALLARLASYGVPPFGMEPVQSEEEAVALANAGEFGLGASIFSRDVARARALAARLRCGFVLINDVIVPTADPRMPFGGMRASGFGTTRGDEGLLEMTIPHVVAVRRGNSRPHFDAPGANDGRLFSSYIRVAHGRGRARFGALRELCRAALCKTSNT